MTQLYDPPLDSGIEKAVEVLRSAGIETFESCQGGDGHAYTEPTIRFHGDRSEGFKGLAVAIQRGFKVVALRRAWPVVDGEPTGPLVGDCFRTVPPRARTLASGLIYLSRAHS